MCTDDRHHTKSKPVKYGLCLKIILLTRLARDIFGVSGNKSLKYIQ